MNEIIFSVDRMPISNRYLSNNAEDKSPLYNLSLAVSTETGIISMVNPFPVHELRPRYDWLTCYEPEEHLDNIANIVSQIPNLNKDSKIYGFSYKDESFLNRMRYIGYTNCNKIDPVHDLGIGISPFGIESMQLNFNHIACQNILKRIGPIDLFVFRHVIEHAYNIDEFFDTALGIVKQGAYAYIELPCCKRLINSGDPTMLWEEHIHYFTESSFSEYIRRKKVVVYYSKVYNYKFEDCIVIILQNTENVSNININYLTINDDIYYARLYKIKFEQRKFVVKAKLKELKSKHTCIALFGAGHLAVTFLAALDIGEYFDFVIDDDKNKNELLLPVFNLPIYSSDILQTRNIQLCLLSLNPQNQEKIIANNQLYISNGGIFASIFPDTLNDFINI